MTTTVCPRKKFGQRKLILVPFEQKLEQMPAPDEEKLEGAKTRPWIVNPAIDILFCCGGLMWVFFLVHMCVVRPIGGDTMLQIAAIGTIASTHALSETHIAATLARVYKTPERRKSFAPYTHWAAIGCALLAVAGLFVEGITPILAKIYMLWLPQHFTGQTYGLTLMYCYKSNYRLSNVQKNLLWLVMNSTAGFAILRQLTYKEWNPEGFLAQHIPFWGPLPEWIIQWCLALLIASSIGLACCIFSKYIKERHIMPLPALLTMVTGVAIFVANFNTTGFLWLYVPAFYHGSQYVVLSIAYHLRENKHAATVEPKHFGRLFLQSPGVRYEGLLLLIAITIFIGLPRVLAEFGFSYTLAFASVFVAINLHHFITDRAIWKLRHKEVREILLA